MAAVPDAAPKTMTAAAHLAPALVGVKGAEGDRAAGPEIRQAPATPLRAAAPPVVVATSPLVVALVWERAASRPAAALR